VADVAVAEEEEVVVVVVMVVVVRVVAMGVVMEMKVLVPR